MIFSTAGIILAASLFLSCNTGREKVETATFLIDSIRSQRVPDSRVAVFSIKASALGKGIQLSGRSSEPEAFETLINLLEKQGVPITDSVIRLPEKKLGDKLFGLITISVANIRSNPAQSSELATQALMGTPVRILDENNGYYLIQTPDKYISYVETGAVSPKTAEEMDQWKKSERIIFTGDYTLVLSQADEKSVPVSDLVMGAILINKGSEPANAGFIPVLLPDGRQGYVKSASWVEFSEWTQSTGFDKEKITTLSKLFMGRPYLWGGTSAKGMDCSGFTKTLYFMSGFILSRDASQQVYQGTEIENGQVWKGLEKGDLIFFGRKATEEKPERATHVAMYLGDSYVIHATPSMIRINSLDSTRADFRKYYLEIMLHVKRMAGSPNEPVKIVNHPWYN